MPHDLFDEALHRRPARLVFTRIVVLISVIGHATVLTVVCMAQLLAQGTLPAPRRPAAAAVRLVRTADIPLPRVRRSMATPSSHAPAAPKIESLTMPRSAAPVDVPVGVRPETAADATRSGPGVEGVPARPLADLADTLAPPVRPAVPAAGPIRLHQGVAAPVPLSNPPPAYPSIARTARVEGTVILDVVIDETGRVASARVLRSVPLLDQAAVDAITGWQYEPARLNGVPIAISMTVTVRFTLSP